MPSRVHTPRGGCALNSRAAGDARAGLEPGTRWRGIRRAARPAWHWEARERIMPADIPGKPRASPLAGAPASASRTPNKPRRAAEHRKSSKPVMEKRRRARINDSLAQLKTLILDALRKDVSRGRRVGREIDGLRRGAQSLGHYWAASRPHRSCPQSSRHSKLEKADILEMTVRHLQSLRRVQVTAALSADPAVLGKYRAGFNECLAEVNRFLAGCEGVPADVRSRLLGHLAACLGQLGPSCQPAPPPPAAEVPVPEVYAGRPLLPTFDGPFPLLRPGATFALPLLPGLTGAPAAPRSGPQGQGAPWRPWLR
ncbi:transcription factor HES-4 isoform X1 [Diceros bicornis minor]|uniref:transcription factor HES-4 isoform X1 n=1 Tax=Diceros bicornis minor TaxID=77932 RepID=UPI0026EA9FA5|nr:transcription factor HES-4 isoform X1 [Diceros bicornis minor]